MQKLLMTLIIIALSVSALFPQPRRTQPTQTKSTIKAALMSAALPGTGQLYYGKNTKASIFLSADLLILGSYFRFQREKNGAIDSYKQYANVYADLRMGASDEIYRLAQRYNSSEEYNNSVELFARHWILLYNDPDFYEQYMTTNIIPQSDSWEWEYEAQRYKYTDIRQDKQRFEIYQQFALGAILLNRVISVLDTVIFKDRQQKAYSLYSTPDFDGKGIKLIYEYNF